MVNICMLSVSDSSRPAKLRAAPTDLKVKVFGCWLVCVVFLGCWLVCVVFYGWLVCVVFIDGWCVWYFRFGWLVCGILWLSVCGFFQEIFCQENTPDLCVGI